LSRYDFNAQRLFVDAPFEAGARLAPPADALNYLLNVLRLREGEIILVFNGRDGEWRARLVEVTKRSARLALEERLRAQDAPGDLIYAFAPLKQARLDYMAQKAAEMGAARLTPVITRRTQMRRVNEARLRANAIEAAEQCGILTPPAVDAAVDLDAFLAALEPQRLLVFCDEDAEVADPLAALRASPAHEGAAVLIGPEGGFDAAERAQIMQHQTLARISLGPRILRADTAAVAALALVQAIMGDWGGAGR
jgi:16S rRNA (uracil1498-N3)-methyltransferase